MNVVNESVGWFHSHNRLFSGVVYANLSLRTELGEADLPVPHREQFSVFCYRVLMFFNASEPSDNSSKMYSGDIRVC